ncbi:MAG: hypothetical protein IH895_02425 [Planctomycetes bacterium]|nr:hypothetical protein [Planctomycetota bacterium]
MYGTQFAQIIPPRALDSDQSHFLHHLAGSDLSANRNLTWLTGDADRQATLQGDPTLDDWFDQSVKTSAAPTFSSLTLSGLDGVLRASGGAVSDAAGFSDLAAAAADVDLGGFKFTARQLESDVAAGTAPFVVASTDVVPNLNADLLDGQHAAAFAGSSHTHALADLSDVDTTAVSTGDFLQKSAGDWVDFDLFDSANTWTQAQTLSSSNKLILRDADIFIHSPGNGIMTLESDVTLNLNINGSQIGSFSAGLLQGLTVDGSVTADAVRVESDSGGSGSRVTLTNVSVAPGTGGKAALDKVVTLGSGPTSTGQSKWLKIYDGLTDYWIPIWT